MKNYRVTLYMDVEARNKDEAIEEFAYRVGEGAYNMEAYKIEEFDMEPICPVYKEKILPDEKNACSLCGTRLNKFGGHN